MGPASGSSRSSPWWSWPPHEVIRRTIAAGLLGAVLSVSLWIGWTALRVERSAPPSLRELFSGAGLSPDARGKERDSATVVIVFHTDCPYCVAELDGIEARADSLTGLPILFLTPELPMPTETISTAWPRLWTRDRSYWRHVPRNRLTTEWGIRVTPTTWVFRGDSLVRRFKGRVSWLSLLAELDSLPPEASHG